MSAELLTGIYRVYDPATQESFIGWSHNLNGTIKRLRFELTLNACPYRPLQKFCNEHSEFAIEILERCDEWQATDVESEAHILARLYKWREKLGDKTRLIQTTATV